MEPLNDWCQWTSASRGILQAPVLTAASIQSSRAWKNAIKLNGSTLPLWWLLVERIIGREMHAGGQTKWIRVKNWVKGLDVSLLEPTIRVLLLSIVRYVM